MRKKTFNCVLALGLAAVMTLSLGACGKNSNAALAKENVYKGSPIALSGIEKSDDVGYGVVDVKQNDDGIHIFMYENHWQDNTFQYRVITVNKNDLTNKEFTLETMQSENLYDYAGDGEDWEGGVGDGTGGDDGFGVTPLTTTETVGDENATEDIATNDLASETGDKVTYNYINYSYSSFELNQDGSVIGLEYCNKDGNDAMGNYISENTTSFCRWNADGSLAAKKAIEGVGGNQDSWSYVNGMYAGKNNTYYLMVQGDENYILTLDEKGETKGKKAFSEDLNKMMNTVEKAGSVGEGVIRVLYHDENDYAKTYLGTYNFNTEQVSDVMEISGSIMSSWDYGSLCFNQDGSLLFTGNAGVYSCKPGDTEPKLLMDYVNSDFFANSMYNVAQLGEDKLLLIYQESWDSEKPIEAGVFAHVKPEDIPDKEVFVAAANGFNYDMKQRAINYNKSNDKYRIVLKDYSIYSNYDDYTAGVTKLNNDIISSGMPDMLVNYSYNSLPVDSYISKGWIADIKDFIAKDEELSQVEFLENLWEAYSIDGKLYQLAPSFSVSTVLAKESLVGNLQTFTLDDMKKVVAGMEPEAVAFREMTREAFMTNVMNFRGNLYVNVENGKCNFNSPDFIAMLEYAKTLPETIEYGDDYWENYDWQKEQNQYRENRTLLMQTSYYAFNDLLYTMKGSFGEPVTFIGFPGGEGKGSSYLQCDTTYLISSNTKCGEGVWDFLRYYLTDDYQRNETYYLPANKAIFMEKSKEAMERPYWTDENGVKNYYDYTMTINDEEVTIDPLNQQELDQVVNFIMSVSNTGYQNDDISKIITEESGAFFAGQKSAAEVADTIQRRAQVYVDENR